jgi:hypothetical protein
MYFTLYSCTSCKQKILCHIYIFLCYYISTFKVRQNPRMGGASMLVMGDSCPHLNFYPFVICLAKE